MNASRCLVMFACCGFSVGLWAQNPVLQLERRHSSDGDAWTGRTALAFRVTVLHPAMRPGASEEEFVFDPPGGWRSAIQLLVTDATGKSVDWPFVNMGQNLDQPLRIHRLGTASASFILEPPARGMGVAYPEGKYHVRARLASTAGKWRGTVDSRPVSVRLAGAEQPHIQVVGFSEGPLWRGWPLLVGVKLTAPEGYDGGLVLPTEEKEWPKAISLTLIDSAGTPVALPIERLPVTRADVRPSQLNALQSRTTWFRVPGEGTRSLGQGPYRWLTKFTLPAPSNRTQHVWSGSVSATTDPTPVVTPPVPLSAELARHQTWAHVEDLLVEAKLIRDRTEGGYMNDRMMAVRQSAVPLLNAERLALQWHEAHPDDPGGAVLIATVMAAQENKTRAVGYTQRAIEAEQRRRSAAGGTAAKPALGLSLMARGFEAMPEERHAVLSPELRTALQKARAEGTPTTAKAPPPPLPTSAPTPAPVASAPVAATPTASLPAVPVAPVPTVAVAPVSKPMATSPGAAVTSSRVGEPSPGKIVPSGELVDAKIRSDAAGQWATAATAGSQYDRVLYSAAQATGAPNIEVAGNSPHAWCPASRDTGKDWLELTFAKPVHATEVRVRQNDAAGALVKIEAIDSEGTAHIWWEGVDPHKTSTVREIVWFAVRVPKTPYLVARVKLTLNLASGPGYKEIDAVQLVAAP
jgi:hypothetical protein